MSDLKKIAVIGKSDTILPFRSIGAESFDIKNSEELVETLKLLANQGNYGIIFVEEELAEPVLDVISAVNDQYRGLAVTPIPGTSGDGGVALKNLTAQVIRAIGMDIFAQKGGN